MVRTLSGRPGGRRLICFAASLALIVFVLAWRAPIVHAATTTITVTGTGDSATTTPCTTSCATLRDAAAEANSLTTNSASPVTIVLAAGTTDISAGAINLGSSTNLDFTLTGPDTNPAGAVILATGSPANQGQGVLVVQTFDSVASTFENLTITGGDAGTGTFGGGAILTGWNHQITTISNCVFTNNTSGAAAGGGAVAMEGGPGAGASLSVTGSTFTGNSTSVGPGGAMLAENNAGSTGQVTLAGDTFSNNTAASPAADGGAFGGAVQVVSASLSVSRSVFQHNVAEISGAGAPAEPPSGGAIYVDSAPSASITTSTFLDNSTSAGGEGGAIFNNVDALTVSFSRLVGNTSSGGHGDAVVNETNGGTVTATDNWWGQNSGPAANEVDNNPSSGTPGAVPTTSPNLQLQVTASASTLNVGATSGLAANLFLLTNGTMVPAGSLFGLASFTGTLNGQPVTYVNGSAGGTFTATSVGSFPVSASADNQTVSTTITVQATPLAVTILGTQTFGSSAPSFTAVPQSGSLPSGVALSGTATCATVNSGTAIGPSLAAGSYTIDAGSCSGLSLAGPNAGGYTLTLVGGTFTVTPQSLSVTVAGSQAFGSSSPAFTAAPTSGSLPSAVALSGTVACTTVDSGTPIGPSLALGTYTIDAGSCSGLSLSGPNAGDYAVTLVGGTFTVSVAPLSVTISGSQTFGSSSPAFTPVPTSGSLPPAVTLNGSVTCTTVNSGTPISASLAAGSYTINAASCSGLSLSGANAGDYVLSLAGGTFTVTPQSVSVTVTGSQTFGSSSPSFTAVATSGSLPPGVSLSGTVTCTTVNSGEPVNSTLPAGSYTIDAASCSGLSLSGANAGDYALSLVGGTFVVNVTSLSVTVSGSQTFGSPSPAFSEAPTSGSLPSGVRLSGTPTCATVNSGTPIDATLAAGSYTIDAASCGGVGLSGPNAGDYTLIVVGGTFTVSPARLSVTVAGSQTFGSSSPTFTDAPTSGSLPSGVTLKGTPACTTVNSGTPIGPALAAGSYTIDAGSCSGLSLSGASAGDYALSLAGGSFTVSAAPLSVTVTGSQTFGSPSPTFSDAPTSGSLPSGVTLKGTPTCTTVDSGNPIDASLPAGSYTIDGSSCSGVSLVGANAGDYTLTLAGGTFTVNPATLPVTMTGSQTFGSSSPTFTPQGPLPSGVTLSGTCTAVNSGIPIDASLPVGTYTIDAASCGGVSLSGPKAGDYTLTLAGGTFTVNPAALSVTVTGSETFGSSSPTFTAAPTSGLLPSGVTLTGTVTCATVDSGTPTDAALPAGSFTIDAASCSGLGLVGPNAGNYTPSLVGGTFTVSPAALQVSVSGTQTSGSSTPVFTAAPTSGSLPSGVTLSGTARCTKVTTGATINASLPAGVYVIDATSCSGLTLAGANAGDYTVTLTGGPFVDTQSGSQIAVTFSPQSPTVGQTVTFTATVAGDPPSGTVTFTLGATTLGTAQLNSAGEGTFSTSSLPVGTNTVTVAYSGDSSFAPSSTSVTVQVAAGSPSSTAGSSSSPSSTAGSSTTGSGVTPGLPATGMIGALAASSASGTRSALTVLGGILLLLLGVPLLVVATRRRARVRKSRNH